MLSVLHLTSATFFGGPERQMLGLARSIAPAVRTHFLSFREGDACRAFVEEARKQGFPADSLRYDTPHFRSAVRELADFLRSQEIDVLCVHGYKAGLLGRSAARRAGVPIIAVSRGWTYESPKVCLYEMLDRLNLRWMDRVVCVSRGQAAKVRDAGVPARKIVVIPNAIDASRFASPDPTARSELARMFAGPVRSIVGAAGRLSPEKGFKDLVEAAAMVVRSEPGVGFLLFGEGKLRPALEAQIEALGLRGRFILAGFRSDLDRLIPAIDLFVQSSYTEGMPNVVLEACAAGVPVVATAVGGTVEILPGELSTQLVPPREPAILAERIRRTLVGDARNVLGSLGREHIRRRFTFESQATQYRDLFASVIAERPRVTCGDASTSVPVEA